MTDQDWEVDGATGGSAPGSSGTGSSAAGAAGGADDRRSAPDPSGSPTAKVVPFPGNWFGSVDELIPIRPASRGPVIELAPDTGLAREGTGPLDVDVAAADASDFWEGDADALEEVSVPAEPQSAIALLRSPGAPKRKPASGHTRGAQSGSSTEADPVSENHRARGVIAALVALAAAAVCVLLATGALSGRADPGKRLHTGHLATVAGHHAAPAVTQTITSAVTVTTTVRTRPHHPRAARTGIARRAGTAGRTEVTHTTSGSTSLNGAASQTVPASTPPPSISTATSTPSHSSATSTSSSSGSGCAAQSPDSGCRP
jgi:hypothetical protein